MSPATYDYATALYSITNRRAEEQLDAAGAQIAAAAERGELPAREAGWLQDIIDDARDGDWRSANKAARRMMEDQVKRRG